jgi:hypothetical protein
MLHEDRERATSFGSDPDLYHQGRSDMPFRGPPALTVGAMMRTVHKLVVIATAADPSPTAGG